MVLYADESAFYQFILPDLLNIALNDGGIAPGTAFGKNGAVRPDLVSVNFQQNAGNVNVGTDVLAAIANQTLYAVTIFGVQSDFTLPSGALISTIAGGTYPPWSAVSLSVDPAGDQIMVYYDVGDCYKRNWWVFGQDLHTHITFPSYVILFHELAHVQDILDGSYQQGSDKDAEDLRAIAWENQYRPIHKSLVTNAPQPLPLRGPKEKGGCGFVIPPDQMKAPGGNSYCLVSTAALSPEFPRHLAEIARLREFFGTRSLLVSILLDELERQYRLFSGQISLQMWRSISLQSCVRAEIVLPLLQYYSHLSDYLTSTLGESCSADVANVSGRRIPDAIEEVSGGSPDEVLKVLMDVKMEWTHGSSSHVISAASAPPPRAEAIRHVLTFVLNSASSDWMEWALLDPLITYNVLGRDICREGPTNSLWLQRVDNWLVWAPIPSSLKLLPWDTVRNEVTQLGTTIFQSQSLRRLAATRLLEFCEGAPWHSDLRRLLNSTWSKAAVTSLTDS